jgi:hypothetical protein
VQISQDRSFATQLFINKVGQNRTLDFQILYICRTSVYTVYEKKWIHSELIHRGGHFAALEEPSTHDLICYAQKMNVKGARPASSQNVTCMYALHEVQKGYLLDYPFKQYFIGIRALD